MQQNYDVMRLIRQNTGCHIIMDNVAGESLGEYVTHNPTIEKEQFYQWIIQLGKEMECIEAAKGISEYRFLMPFNVILKDDQRIALLNLKTKSNQKRLEKLLVNKAVNQFFPEDGTYNDIYSFGRTLQYLLSKVNMTPQLSKKEEKQFRKIISKCLKVNSRKSYQNFQEILLEIPYMKKEASKKRVIFLGICAILLSILAILKVWFMPEESKSNENSAAYIETGITYFNTLEDYQKSEELFGKAEQSDYAEYYQKMARYMQDEARFSDKEMEELLESFERKMGYELDYDQKYCLLKVYDKIGSETAKKQVIRLAEEILDSTDWYKNEKEVRAFLEKAQN